MSPRAARARRSRRSTTPRSPPSSQKPLAVLNLGGVANVTWIGEGADEILAFDTGPGNALIDDWVRRHTGAARPISTARSRAAGSVDAAHVEHFLAHALFRPRRRRNRSTATISRALPADGLSLADGAATLTEMTAAAVARGGRAFPAPGAANGWSPAAAGTIRR